ncbi:MAG: DoxX family protein [Nitriliruptorales bacterium]
MSFGLLLLRVVVGALFVGHGTQKLFGWFGGHGPDGTGSFLDSLDYREGRTMAVVTGTVEAASGALLVLGFLTPFAAAGILGVMLNAAVAAHAPNGLWNSEGGYELPLVNATAAVALAFTGPGAASLDNAFGFGLEGGIWGTITLVTGLGAGAAVLAAGREAEPVEVEAEEERARDEPA